MDIGKWMCNIYDDEGVWEGSDRFDTKEEAIQAGIKECEHEELKRFWVGQIAKVEVVPDIRSEHVLESLLDSAYDQVEEGAEGYLEDVKVEHEHILDERLEKVVMDWLKEFGYEPDLEKIINIEKIKLKESYVYICWGCQKEYSEEQVVSKGYNVKNPKLILCDKCNDQVISNSGKVMLKRRLVEDK